MRFSLRKSINLGLIRLNFSKSGVGVSVGVPGFRGSTGPSGTSMHLGRKGFYYRKKSSPAPGAAKPQRPFPHQTSRANHYRELLTEKGKVTAALQAQQQRVQRPKVAQPASDTEPEKPSAFAK